MSDPIRLGVNIDHVATLRNARGGGRPCPVRAALAAQKAGADGITVHLREDRRHIRDADLFALKERVGLPLNLEMAATEEMARIACRVRPHAACIVPERRQEVTTEGGLDAVRHREALAPVVASLKAQGIRVSLFLDPAPEQIRAAHELGADVVELHTGAYAGAASEEWRQRELEALHKAAELLDALGIECHAGHGLDFENVLPVCGLRKLRELNIGHALIGEALFVGMERAVAEMLGIVRGA
jgi:pyridoxine 5-phosphate synthase